MADICPSNQHYANSAEVSVSNNTLFMELKAENRIVHHGERRLGHWELAEQSVDET